MKKTAVLLGGVCVVALIAGGVLMMSKGQPSAIEKPKSKTEISVYWDGQQDINQVASYGTLPLIKAVREGDIDNVSYLLDKGAKASATDKNGESAVNAALKSGHADIFKMLIAKDNIALRQAKYLSDAIDGGNVELVKTILDTGLNVNVILEVKGRHRPDEELDYMDPRVVTALKKAVEESKKDVVSLLLDRGAEGAQFFLLKAITKGDAGLVKVLANKVGNLRDMSVKGVDLLTSAVTEANPDMIEFLLDKNVGDVNSALFRLLVYREANETSAQILDTFLKAGATPTSDMLLYTLKKGKNEQFLRLASCLSDPNLKPDNEDDNLFLYSLHHNNIEALNFYLQRGADIWQLGHDGLSALEFSIKNMKDNPDVYEAVKKNLKTVNDEGYLGETLLMLLAKNGEDKEFMNVVNAGGDIWQKDRNGKTMLMYAAEGGSVAIIDYLAKKGENLMITDKNGRTPLMYAAEAGKLDAVNDLMNKGAVSNATDDDGKYVIMYAAGGGHKDVVERLMDEGESVAVLDKNRKNVLMYALESGDMDTIKAITNKGFDIYSLDKNDRSLLHYAVLGGNVEAVKFLINRNVNIYAADKNDYQPIVLAIKNNQKEIFDLLRSNTEVLRRKTKDNGKSIPMYAMESGNIDFIRWAVEKFRDAYNLADNEGVNFVMEVAKYGRPDILRDIMHRGGNVRAYDKHNKYVLMYAAESENAVNFINMLPEVNSSYYINLQDFDGASAFMYAVGGKYNQIIKQQRLLQYDANINQKDKQGKSVLMYAVGNPYARVDNQAIRELIYRGADVNVLDSNGKNALMYAAGNPNVGMTVMETLLNAGANIHAVDHDGKTVLMYAAECGNISKFKLLLEYGARTGGATKKGQKVQDFADKIGSCFADAVRALIKN